MKADSGKHLGCLLCQDEPLLCVLLKGTEQISGLLALNPPECLELLSFPCTAPGAVWTLLCGCQNEIQDNFSGTSIFGFECKEVLGRRDLRRGAGGKFPEDMPPAPRSCSPSPTSVQVDTPRNTGLVGRQELDGRKLASCLRMDGKAELLIIGASLPLSLI